MINKYDVIVPLAESDVETFLSNVSIIKDYICVKNFIVIGNAKVEQLILNSAFDGKFINEDLLINYNSLRKYIQLDLQGDELCCKRTGWYLQQFLKMAYAQQCEDEFYIVWDSDTIPTRTVEFFDGEKPVFDIKTENHIPYFDTLKNLFPDVKKSIDGSFIAEHMIISTSIMKEMIACIERKFGKPFYMAIMDCVSVDEIPYSGFSEFETFGNYCMIYHKDYYKLRDWRSLREAAIYFDKNSFTVNDIAWIRNSYDAVSFEKGVKCSKIFSKICGMSLVRRLFCINQIIWVHELCVKMRRK